jgi:enoyl-CoA hydratase/carnithine racemase
MARASAWLLLGEAFSAQEAFDAGLVNAIAPNEELLGVAREKAARLAAKPRAAVAQSRRLLRGDPEILLERIDIELEAFARALKSFEARAALAAFLDKRK